MPSASLDAEVHAVTVIAPGEAALVRDAPGWSGPLGADEVFGTTVRALISPGTEIAGAFRPDPARETQEAK